MSNRTAYLHSRRSGFFRDRDGVLSFLRDKDATEVYTLDYANELDSGDTISTSTWSAEGGQTLSGQSDTTTATAITVSGTPGELKNTVVTANGRALVKRVMEYQSNLPNDYR